MDLHFITPELAETLGWMLIHSLWQGALIFVLLAPLLGLFKDHAPQLRYNLLCLGLLGLLATMIITFSLHMPAPDPQITWLENEQISREIANAPQENLAPEIVTAKIAPSYSIAALIHRYGKYLVQLWLMGGLLFGLRWVSSLFYTQRLKNTLTRELSPDWQKQVATWSRKLGIHRSVRLLESAKVEVPVIIGHIKPYILLPIGSINGLEPQQIEAIIMHELAHIKRHDFLINVILSGLEMILFYHPVYWWLANRIHQEREQCCDDIAVSACGNPRLYARTLLLMEEKRQQKTLAMTYQGKKHHLLDRIKRICATPGNPYRFEFGKAGLSLVLLLTAAAISWAKLPAQPDYDDDPVLETPASIDLPSSQLPETLHATVSMTVSEPQRSGSEIISEPPSGTERPHLATPPQTSHLSLSDTIPYVADIPKMKTKPTLAAPPTFPFTKADVLQEFAKDAADRSAYREKIDQYKDQLNQWKAKIQQEYLQPWDLWNTQVKLSYNKWKMELQEKSGGDQLAYYIALKNGSKQFSDALSEEESAIRDSEQVIRSDVEDGMRVFEEALREIADDRQDRDERMAVRDDRMRIHDLRMAIHDVRMSIHDARMGIHDSRMGFHDDRMTAYDFIRAKFEKEFFDALAADGLYDRSSKKDLSVIIDDKMTVNGKDLSTQLYQKYGEMVKKYGFDYSRESPFVVKISDKMYQFGNSMQISE